MANRKWQSNREIKYAYHYIIYHRTSFLLAIIGVSIGISCLFTLDFLTNKVQKEMQDGLQIMGSDVVSVMVNSSYDYSGEIENFLEVELVSKSYDVQDEDVLVKYVDNNFFRLFSLDVTEQNFNSVLATNDLKDSRYQNIIDNYLPEIVNMYLPSEKLIIRPFESNDMITYQFLSNNIDRSCDQLAVVLTGIDYQIICFKEIASFLTELINFIKSIIIGISFISIFVSIFGICGVLIVMGVQRKRELGIKKALGISNKHIILQNLYEALFIGTIGIVMALLLTLLIKGLICIFLTTDYIVNYSLIMILLVIILPILIFFYLFISKKTAQKNCFECLN